MRVLIAGGPAATHAGIQGSPGQPSRGASHGERAHTTGSHHHFVRRRVADKRDDIIRPWTGHAGGEGLAQAPLGFARRVGASSERSWPTLRLDHPPRSANRLLVPVVSEALAETAAFVFLTLGNCCLQDALVRVGDDRGRRGHGNKLWKHSGCLAVDLRPAQTACRCLDGAGCSVPRGSALGPATPGQGPSSPQFQGRSARRTHTGRCLLGRADLPQAVSLPRAPSGLADTHVTGRLSGLDPES